MEMSFEITSLLFASVSPPIKHTGKPAELAVKANESVHALLNSLFSSEYFLFLGLESI